MFYKQQRFISKLLIICLSLLCAKENAFAARCRKAISKNPAVKNTSPLLGIEEDDSVYYDGSHSFPARVLRYKAGTVIAYTSKDVVHGKEGQSRFKSLGAVLVKDPKYKKIQNNPAMNCHAFAIRESGVPDLPDIFWINAGSVIDKSNSFRVLLKTYFTKIQTAAYKDDFSFSPKVQEGDLITFVHAGWGYSEHSGVIINRGGELWIRSKLGEGAVFDAPLSLIFTQYDKWDTVEVYRRK